MRPTRISGSLPWITSMSRRTSVPLSGYGTVVLPTISTPFFPAFSRKYSAWALAGRPAPQPLPFWPRGRTSRDRRRQKLEIRYDRNYRVQFTYDPERQVYLRSVNGEPHRDGESGVQIACGTIIVQVAEHKVKDAEGRVEIRFVGRGSGWMFLRGKAVPIVWEKKNFREKTRYYLQDGREARIASFPVWVEVIDSQEKVVF